MNFLDFYSKSGWKKCSCYLWFIILTCLSNEVWLGHAGATKVQGSVFLSPVRRFPVSGNWPCPEIFMSSFCLSLIMEQHKMQQRNPWRCQHRKGLLLAVCCQQCFVVLLTDPISQSISAADWKLAQWLILISCSRNSGIHSSLCCIRFIIRYMCLMKFIALSLTCSFALGEIMPYSETGIKERDRCNVCK